MSGCYNQNKIFDSNVMTIGIAVVVLSILLLSLLVYYGISSFSYYQEAFGHAFVIDTEPESGAVLSEPPTRIDAFINEPVDLTYSQISVIGSDGEQIDTGDLGRIDGDESTLTTTLPTDLSEGTYTVSVQMLSQIDGHLTQDTFVFGVGEQGEITAVTASGDAREDNVFDLEQISTGSTIARFPALVGQVMVVGAAFCLLWLWRPVTRIKWLHERFMHTQTRIQYRTILLMIAGAIILIVSDFAMIFSLAISIGAPLVDTINTTFGEVWLARTVLSFIVLIFTVLPFIKIQNKRMSMTRDPFTGNNGNRSKYIITSIIFVLGLAVLLTTSLMGHAAAISGSLLPISLDYIHNVVASLWIGGVIYLAFVVAPILKKSISSITSNKDEKIRIKKGSIFSKLYKLKKVENDYGEKKKDDINNGIPDLLTINSVLSIIIPKFSFVPVIILGAILLTGPFLLYVLEDDLTLTLFSLYGIILLAKLALAAVMISIGIYYQVAIHKQSLNLLITHSTQTPSGGTQQTQLLDKYNNKNNKAVLDEKNNRSNNIKLEKIVSKFNSGLKAEAIVGILLLGSVALLTNTGLPESERGLEARQLFQLAGTDDTLDEDVNLQGYTATRFLTNEMTTTNDDDNGGGGGGTTANQNNVGDATATTNAAITDTEISPPNRNTNNNDQSEFTKVLLSIEPFQPGNNKITVSFLDASGNPLDYINEADIRLAKTSESIGQVAVSIAPITLDTQQISSGVFSANATFGFPGQWEIEVEGITNKSGVSNLYAVFDPFVKPSLEQLTFNLTEFNGTFPIQPLYPVYDGSRNVIWVGDTILNSGRILEFDLTSEDYVRHNISDASVITQLTLDTNNSIWYIDPLRKILGHYEPQIQLNEVYQLFDTTQSVRLGSVFPQNQANVQEQQQPQPPLSLSNISESQGAPSAIDIDSENNVWITIANTNIVLKFDPSNETFTKIGLPTLDANPLDVTVDETDDAVWIAESGAGKIAKIETSNMNNYTVIEFAPRPETTTAETAETDDTTTTTTNTTLEDPIFILPDPQGREVYISEHEGQAISVFDQVTETFRQIPLFSQGALPFGMVFDDYNNLWVAEHLTNTITVINPQTGEQNQVSIDTLNPFVQYLAVDSEGQIWAAEQRGNAMARVDINTGTLVPTLTSDAEGEEGADAAATNDISGKILGYIEELGFERFTAPLIAAGIIVVSLVYIRTIYTFSKSIEYVKMMEVKEKF